MHGRNRLLTRTPAIGLLALLVSMLVPLEARAGCANPAGKEGEIVYNDDFNVMQFCDGSDWVGMGGGSQPAEVADGDKGDVTVSGAGGNWTIDTGAVSYAKLQPTSGSGLLLGRASPGGGTVEEISLGPGLALSGTTLSAAAGAAGLDGEVQYNSGGVLAADAGLTYADGGRLAITNNKVGSSVALEVGRTGSGGVGNAVEITSDAGAGLAVTASGANGIFVTSSGTPGNVVYGISSAASGSTYGGHFVANSTSGTAVFGAASAASGSTYGGYFQAASTQGKGVQGVASALSGGTYGGYFQAASSTGIGVKGVASAVSGGTYGGYFQSLSTSGNGVFGLAGAASGATYGGNFTSMSPQGTGIYGVANASTGTTYGGRFKVNSPSGYAIYAEGRAHVEGTLSSSGGLTTTTLDASGEVDITTPNALRMVYGNYGAFWRNDGSTLYLLLTASGDQYGIWNALRPFYVNLATGAVGLGNGVTITGTATATTFSGSGSGLTSLNASNLSTGTVPAARLGSGTANSSTFLRGDGTWTAVSASPGGSNSQVQFNNGGSFGGSANLVWDSTNARLGIGTTSPQKKLHVEQGDITLYSTSSSDPLYSFGFEGRRARGSVASPTAVTSGDLTAMYLGEGYDGSAYRTAGGMMVFTDGAVSAGKVPGRLVFATADSTGISSERMRIDSSGRVGIGTTAPSQALDVQGNVNVSSAVIIQGGGLPFTPMNYGYLNSSGGTGRCGSGCGGYFGLIVNNGNRAAAGEFDATSDRRKKTDIAGLTSALADSFLEKAKPVTFEWIDRREAGTRFGFIAQDIIKAGFGSMVGLVPDKTLKKTTDADGLVSPEGAMFNLNYDSIIPIVVKGEQDDRRSLRELQAQMTKLRADNDNLRALVEEQGREIEALRAAR